MRPATKPRILILGSGPNRIGQGIEFDYCCVHASFVLREAGYETVMVNCNPETVSTDYDTSDRLYFEPLTTEDVLNVIEAEQPIGVVVALGGQTPLKLAGALPPGLVMGTSAESIDRAEDREQWNALSARLEIPQPAGGTATSAEAARAVAARVGYPALVRPSYVLGGRAMQIVYDDDELNSAMAELAGAGSLGREGGLSAERPVLIDRFLEDAVEVDVDAIRDATGEVLIGGVMEHVEEAGVHSGDSASALPPPSLTAAVIEVIETYTRSIAAALDVRGLLNVQYAVKAGQVFVLEANPRASRTVPFVAKATGVPLVKVAARVMVGATLAELREEGLLRPPTSSGHTSVKEAVLPFNRFPGVDTVLGPEMRSTGEVMGIDRSFGLAFAKSQIAAGNPLPIVGHDLHVARRSRQGRGRRGCSSVRRSRLCHRRDFGHRCASRGPPCAGRRDRREGRGGHRTGRGRSDLVGEGRSRRQLTTRRGARADGSHIRAAANVHRVPCLTTVAAALAAANGMTEWVATDLRVTSLQEHHEGGGDQLALPI